MGVLLQGVTVAAITATATANKQADRIFFDFIRKLIVQRVSMVEIEDVSASRASGENATFQVNSGHLWGKSEIEKTDSRKPVIVLPDQICWAARHVNV